VGLTRSSLRMSTGRSVKTAFAIVALVTLPFGAACGAGAGATATPTVVPTTALPAVPAPSPQRAPLASPVASPATASASATPTTASAAVAGDTYEVQSGDTLLSIAEQFYADNSQWRRIYDANKDVIGSDPDKLKLGMKLTIPPKQ
jgi:nucleoid-associated protein YgaU